MEAWAALGEGRGGGKLLELFLILRYEESFPDSWAEAMVVGFVLKSGVAEQPANIRRHTTGQSHSCIQPTSCTAKIIAARLEDGLSDRLRKTQYGFRKDRSTVEPMFILRRLQDLVHAKQGRA